MKEMRLSWMAMTSADYQRFETIQKKEMQFKVGMCPMFEAMDTDHFKTAIAIQVVSEKDLKLDFTISAVFEMKDYAEDKEDFESAKLTAFGTVFPYVRNTLSQLLALASLPQITLPIVNVSEAFSESRVRIIETKRTAKPKKMGSE